MAESLVSLVVGTLGKALGQELILLGNVREQFERLQKEFVSIKGFFRTVDALKLRNPDMLAWVADVQDVAYDVDDVLSEFFIKVAAEEKRLLKMMDRFNPAELVKAHKMAKKLEMIFTKIEDVSIRRKKYSTEMIQEKRSPATTNTPDPRKTYQHVKDVDIVGLEDIERSLAEELKREDDRRCVVSIWGMGGIGKTTLAKLAYNREDVKKHFHVRAWTFISQECRAEDTLHEILRQVGLEREKMQNMKQVELLETLSYILKDKRYLVVLDDIWKVEDWNMLKSAFPEGMKGSKVMLTTRHKNVALEADSWTPLFEPKILNEEQAWVLMCKKSFRMELRLGKFSLSSEMQKLGKAMVKKCAGLPLAIVALGGILAKKRKLIEWETVSKLLAFHMSQGEDGVYAILGLSFDDLPLHLIPLSLYLGFFPEDYKISVSALIKMWVAEGLVREEQGNEACMELIGRQYLSELVQRSIVVADTNWKGDAKSCQMHDMMREVCVKKAKEENFLQIIHKSMSFSSSSSTKVRRCAIYLEDERYLFPPNTTPCVRSVIFFKRLKYMSSSFYMIHKDFKLVRVLELNGVVVKKMLEEVLGKLLNLRYLGLRNASVKRLPKSIGKLVNLQTLDLRGNNCKLQDVIWKLVELRCFHWDFQGCSGNEPLKMDKLKKLQILSHVRADSSDSWTTYMDESTNLQKLGIIEINSNNVAKIMDSINIGFDQLRSLFLHMSTGSSFSNLDILSAKHHLHKLRLDGRADCLPKRWPSNIVTLKLIKLEVKEDPMPTLEKLEHLTHLTLENGFTSKQIECGEEGFPTLEYLQIVGCGELEEWVVKKGAMPCLKHCILESCNNLKMVPGGFEFVSTLEALEIRKMPVISQRVKRGHEDWECVKHIPSIIDQH